MNTMRRKVNQLQYKKKPGALALLAVSHILSPAKQGRKKSKIRFRSPGDLWGKNNNNNHNNKKEIPHLHLSRTRIKTK